MFRSLARLFKWIFLLSTLLAISTYFYKDDLPDPDYYRGQVLQEPIQLKTDRAAFSVTTNENTYLIQPKYNYELEGIVVSYHDADSAWDMYHHDMWKDFLNVRDICVIWGSNVTSGVYKNMSFESNTWTCWAYWPDAETGRRFSMNQLSNNHLLSNKDDVNRALMSAEPGDHIRLKGVLAEYSNPVNDFTRGTSISRNDTGNGACETIYIDQFTVIKKANSDMRSLYGFAKWTAIISLISFIVMFLAAPVSRAR